MIDQLVENWMDDGGVDEMAEGTASFTLFERCVDDVVDKRSLMRVPVWSAPSRPQYYR